MTRIMFRPASSDMVVYHPQGMREPLYREEKEEKKCELLETIDAICCFQKVTKMSFSIRLLRAEKKVSLFKKKRRKNQF